MPPRKCLYDVLGVPRTIDGADLKKVYRQLALKYHPDKNLEDPERAKNTFQEIQNAYEVLSDPQERAWYDSHREAILQFGEVGTGNDVDIGGIDLFPYFSGSCYHGFGEDNDGFYAVYRQVFEKLDEEDKDFSAIDDAYKYPTFGQSASEEAEWQQFYAFFMAYVTTRTYSWLDKYDTRQAENRRVSRLMEKENKKVRDVARKERNELVRNLAKFIRKRDKRVLNFNRRLEEKAAENAKKTREMRLRHLDERARLLAEAATTASSSSCFEMSGMEKELQALENDYGGSDVEEDAESNYCVACNKQFRNEKAYGNHLKQKKHRENVAALKKLLAEDICSSVVAHGIDVDQLHLELGEINSSPNNIDHTGEGEVELSDESMPSKMGNKKAKKRRKHQHQKQNIAAEEHSEEDETALNLNGSDIEKNSNQSLKEDKKKKSWKKRSNRGITTELEKSAQSCMDAILTNDGDGAVVSRTKKKKNRRKDKGDIENDKSSDDEANGDSKKCAVCATTFTSKNKLFNHLKTSGHAIYSGK